MSEARYTWQILRAGSLLLDGGGMFGVIPKLVWSKSVEADEKNQIEVAHNCLLLTDTQTGRRVLIETGSGDKFDAKMTAIFGLQGPTVEGAMVEAGVDPGDIDAVVVSHLHFDHAGGLTRRVRGGETPDWVPGPNDKPVGTDNGAGVKLTFPNATVFVQNREWEDAVNNDAVMTRTYYRANLLPLKKKLPDGSPRLHLASSPEPFPAGRVPHRDEAPKGRLEDRMTQILPGVSVFRTPGHTWGQQAVLFTDESGREVVFTPDLIPTAHHIGAAYSLSYDVEPYTAMVTKRWFLSEAAQRGWLLVLDHERGECRQRVKPDGRGWFVFEAAE